MACRLLVMGMADRVSRQTIHSTLNRWGRQRPIPPRHVFVQPKKVGQERSSLAQSCHAGGGLPDNCALLQSAVEIPETDAGQ